MADTKPMQANGSGTAEGAPDGISRPADEKHGQGGESEGGDYPGPKRKPKRGGAPGDFMGHGGQTDIDYHGIGQLGEEKAPDGPNPNATTRDED